MDGMDRVEFHVSGEPSLWCVRTEKPWRAAVGRASPVPRLAGQEQCLRLDFTVGSTRRNGVPFDLDNLCETALAALVTDCGWFGRSRRTITVLHATRCRGLHPGCHVTITAERLESCLGGQVIFKQTRRGSFPKRSDDLAMSQWLDSHGLCATGDGPLGVRLTFGSTTVNIADIATGMTKPFIDCLYPLIGGKAGAPADHRIEELIVTKGRSGLDPDQVEIQVNNLNVGPS